MNYKIYKNQIYLVVFLLIILCFLSTKLKNKKENFDHNKGCMETNNMYHPHKCKFGHLGYYKYGNEKYPIISKNSKNYLINHTNEIEVNDDVLSKSYYFRTPLYYYWNITYLFLGDYIFRGYIYNRFYDYIFYIYGKKENSNYYRYILLRQINGVLYYYTVLPIRTRLINQDVVYFNKGPSVYGPFIFYKL